MPDRKPGKLQLPVKVYEGSITCGGYAGTLVTASTTYIKTWEGYAVYGGTYTIDFTLTNNGATTVYARIYRNGSAVGTERSTGTSAAYSEDITGWEYGDLIQIYQKVTPSGNGEVTLLKVKTGLRGIAIPGSSTASVTIS